MTTAGIMKSAENIEQLSDRVINARGGDSSGICLTRTSTFYRTLVYHGCNVLV